ncbi:hypothetical protein CAPTEDRAFT_196655 [Capitella teleta]|uniref:Microtubule-associated protein 10 C-terminal domain-containing protein n=1 Tax=Capitella teleta TaxID=283909 RepID=R7TS45_CAPTE|nr:hypothetical protein CAPTEDRAFT_196655 [Capitella teleta]|eukprot:ELT96743.1 hypothetical protein CAPTEDRAFT_196655 [Capitella teleta]
MGRFIAYRRGSMSGETMMDRDSLFSLEIVVEGITIGDVVCRFPAVAFKLLDFPTLIVQHVEPDLAKSIKQKIRVSSHNQLPKQFKELQNKDGGYTLRKGKSCLFKVPPNILHTMLQSTPLYVMLMDTYPDTPSLVANCTVPLNTLIDDVMQEIREQGLSCPVVQGTRDTYKIFNLMSQPIGSISITYRILSLGMSIMPHIRQESVAELQAHTITSPDIVIPPPPEPVTYLSSADKNIQIAVTSPFTEMSCQTEQRHSGTAATQTDRRQAKHKQPNTMKQNFFKENEDDFLFENVLRPLPLFFNSDAKEKTAWPSELDAKYRVNDIFPHCADSDDETIRVEDLDSEKVGPQSAVEDSLYEPKVAVKKPPQSKTQTPTVQSDQTAVNLLSENLPILTALVDEILLLKAGKISGVPNSQPQAFNVSAGKGRGMQGKVVNPKQAPRIEREASTVSTKKCHSVCTTGFMEVPKNKSWVRQAPSIQSYGKKTNITPGLTNTQRLRLAKNNPHLLAELEEQEKKRIAKRKPTQLQILTREPETSERNPMTIDVNTSGEVSIKKPVPTPRQSKTKMSFDNSEANSFKMQSPSLEKVMTPETEEIRKPNEALMRTHTIVPRTQSSTSDPSESSAEPSQKTDSNSDALFMSSLDLRRVTESYYDDLDSQASSQAKSSSVVMQNKTPHPDATVASDYFPDFSKSSRKFPQTTESISSYVPTEDDRLRIPSAGADYSDEFEDMSDEFQMPIPKSMKELALDPLAKIGSTWHA